MIPGWYTLLLLALAAYRVFRLVGDDTILDAPRRRLLRLGAWREEGDPVPSGYRRRAGEFLKCPWCLGAWCTLAWWGAWLLWPHGTLVAAAPFAISTIVGAVGSVLKPG